MPVNSVAENVFGTIGTVCWSGQIIPQIWKSWKEKATEGLSHWLMFIWGVASAFLGVFAIVQNLNIPLIVQPQLFGFLSIVSWSQCLYYNQKRPLRQTMAILMTTLVVLGGFEAGMVFAVRPAVKDGNERPVQFFGVMTSILLAMGLLPQFFEIFRFGEVKGISLPFMSIDFLGGIFSLLSLVFKEKFDVLAGVAYSLVILMDGAVLILAAILNPRAKRRRRRLAQTETDHESQTANTASADNADYHAASIVDSGVSSTRISTSERGEILHLEKRETMPNRATGEKESE
ncbi:PQ loop repeat-domain-containing protein [Phellopilus nigrolimitatus]|nr:PQ loop repeat-domain-containing protein [Phellopilus nigrolimitatus]